MSDKRLTHDLDVGHWKPGLPPGDYYEGMVDDFECVPAVMGWWHRRRTPEEVAAHLELKASMAAMRQQQPTASDKETA